MAKKRGFLAEVNRQIQLDAKRRAQAQRQAAKAQVAAQRQAEQAARRAETARAQASRALATELKRAEQDAKRLHEEARQAEVAAMNADLAVVYEEIDGMLAATLHVDDYVDLEQLRRVAEHPPFEPGQLVFAAPAPARLMPPPEPEFAPPPGEPKGLSGVFGGRKKYAEQLAQAQAEHDAARLAWEAEVAALPEKQRQIDAAYEAAEREREVQLAAARAAYDEQCRRREAEVAESNSALDQLIANLGYEVEEAIQEYVGIVLDNSVYPESFPVEHDFDYDSAHRELTLRTSVPEPGAVPNVREYKYVRAKDEITESTVTQKEQKDRYANAVAQVAIRSLHEVFEADRAGRIRTISLTVSTSALDPGTGRVTNIPLVGVASDRETFEHLDLTNVVPSATLAHLKALVSKNPFGLVPIDLSKGVRG